MKDLSPLENVQELSIINCEGINLIDTLPKLKKLTLKDFRKRALHGWYNMRDLNELHLESINHLYNDDLLFIQGVHKVLLNDCSNITRVDYLKDINDLTIINCQSIEDINLLKPGNHKVINCNGIKKWGLFINPFDLNDSLDLDVFDYINPYDYDDL